MGQDQVRKCQNPQFQLGALLLQRQRQFLQELEKYDPSLDPQGLKILLIRQGKCIFLSPRFAIFRFPSFPRWSLPPRQE